MEYGRNRKTPLGCSKMMLLNKWFRSFTKHSKQPKRVFFPELFTKQSSLCLRSIHQSNSGHINL